MSRTRIARILGGRIDSGAPPSVALVNATGTLFVLAGGAVLVLITVIFASNPELEFGTASRQWQERAGYAALAAMSLIAVGVLIRIFGAIEYTAWRVSTGRLRARHLWTDDRPVPDSPGRRMLRVFGRLASNVGSIGFFTLIVLAIVNNLFGLTGGPSIVLDLVYIGMVASVGLVVIGAFARTLDGFLVGYLGEDEQLECRDARIDEP